MEGKEYNSYIKSQKQSDILIKKLKSYSCEETSILTQKTKKKENVPEMQFYPYNPRMIPEGVIPKLILEETKAKEENMIEEKKLEEERENAKKEKKVRGRRRKNKKNEETEKNNGNERKIEDLAGEEELDKEEINVKKEAFLNDDNDKNDCHIDEPEIQINDFVNEDDPCLINNNNLNEQNLFEKNEKLKDDNYSMTSSQRDLENLLQETSEDNFDRIFQEKNNLDSNLSFNNIEKNLFSNEDVKENDEMFKLATTKHKFKNDNADKLINREENVSGKNIYSSSSKINANKTKKETLFFERNKENFPFISENSNFLKTCNEKKECLESDIKKSILKKINKEPFRCLKETSNSNQNLLKIEEIPKNDLNNILNKYSKVKLKNEAKLKENVYESFSKSKANDLKDSLSDSNDFKNQFQHKSINKLCFDDIKEIQNSEKNYFQEKFEENKINLSFKAESKSSYTQNSLLEIDENIKIKNEFSINFSQTKKTNYYEEIKNADGAENNLNYVDDDELTLLDKILNDIEKANNFNESKEEDIGLDELNEIDKILFEHEQNEKKRKMKFESEFILKKIKK